MGDKHPAEGAAAWLISRGGKYEIAGVMLRTLLHERDAAEARARAHADMMGEQLRDLLRVMAAVVMTAGGTVRVQEETVLYLSDRDVLRRHDDPATGEIVFTVQTGGGG